MNKMKVFLLTILILNSALSIAQQAEFKFQDKVQRLGKVIEGEIIESSFSFTNVGDEPLIITDCEVACECTEVIFPKEPILPGESKEIIVKFDTNGKIGYQDRTITIHSNAKKSPAKIRFTLTVKND